MTAIESHQKHATRRGHPLNDKQFPDMISRMAKRETVNTSVTEDERRELEAEAARQGVTLSVLVYRRVMLKPDAVKKPGRPRRHPRTQDEGLFGMTG
jgi:hypothetical protein